MRAAVLTLALGLVLSPAPYINIDTGSTAAAGTVTDWPAPPSVAANEFEASLYAAQLMETAEIRRDDRTTSSSSVRIDWLPSWGWAVVLVLGLLIVVVGAFVMTPRRGHRTVDRHG